KARIFSSLSTISITIGKSIESRNILAVCSRLDLPNPIGPRSTVAPARCASRAFKTITSYNGLCSWRSLSPMKIRNMTASCGICISRPFHRIENRPEQEADPDGEHSKDHRQNNIPTRIKPFTVPQQIQRLQAERGKRRVTAADANHK